MHLISPPVGRPATVPGTLNSNTSGPGPLFAGTLGLSASWSPPPPLQAARLRGRTECIIYNTARRILSTAAAMVPFASAEVALHALMNNKRAAQRVGTTEGRGARSHSMKENTTPLIWPLFGSGSGGAQQSNVSD